MCVYTFMDVEVRSDAVSSAVSIVESSGEERRSGSEIDPAVRRAFRKDDASEVDCAHEDAGIGLQKEREEARLADQGIGKPVRLDRDM